MKIKIKYSTALKLHNALGSDGFIKHFNDLFNLDLYSMSNAWIESNEYICKMRGVKGDIILVWQ